jgi:hypothetical protein
MVSIFGGQFQPFPKILFLPLQLPSLTGGGRITPLAALNCPKSLKEWATAHRRYRLSDGSLHRQLKQTPKGGAVTKNYVELRAHPALNWLRRFSGREPTTSALARS